jgi:hypothetical protein
MSKKYKNKKCVYCAEKTSTTADHIFAREFFLLNERNNLPKVPSCHQCNKEKSELEHYLTAILPFGGFHETALENLSTMVPKRLKKNNSLHKELKENKAYVLSGENKENTIKLLTVPIDGQKMLDLFKFITKGLIWYHWQTIIDKRFDVEAISLTQHGEKYFQQKFFSLNSKNKVEESIGNNIFSYQALQAIDIPQITVWEFMIYNGLKVSGSGSNYTDASTKIGAITGPIRFITNFREL